MKYTNIGNAIKVERDLGDGCYLVRYYYAASNCDGSELESWVDDEIRYYEGKIYDTPPVEKISKDIETLEKLKSKLTDDLHAKKRELSDKESEVAERLKELKKYDGLEYAKEYLDGKIEYFVVYDGYCDTTMIYKCDDYIKANSEYDNGTIRLLVLCADKDKKAKFEINRYSDGSGKWTRVWLAHTLEDAKERVRSVISDMFEEAKERNYGEYHISNIVDDAIRNNCTPPEWAVNIAEKYKAEENAIRLKKLEEEKRNIEAKIKKINEAI